VIDDVEGEAPGEPYLNHQPELGAAGALPSNDPTLIFERW
jgi:hypothetical protein